MDDEQLHITGLTGVELTLPIAGPGSRSYAFVIDWHIRVLLSLAWVAVDWLLSVTTKFPAARSPSLMIWPAVAIYLLYHPLLELLMHGRTPGKRMAGVRLVTRRGGQPSAGAIVIRNVFRLLDSAPAFYIIGLSTCMISKDRVRVGDLAAGTVLVLEKANAARLLEAMPGLATQTGMDPRLIELIQDLLERWPGLTPQRRAELARSLLAHAGPTARDALASLNESQLQSRLGALLKGAA